MQEIYARNAIYFLRISDLVFLIDYDYKYLLHIGQYMNAFCIGFICL